MITEEKINKILDNKESREKLVKALAESGVFDNIIKQEDKQKDDFEVIFTHYLNGDGDMREINKSVSFSDLKINGHFLSFSSEQKADRFRRKIFAMQKLDLVADYLNNGWVPDWNNEKENKVFPAIMRSKIEVSYCWERITPLTPLKTEELFNRAKEIMGKEAMKDMFL